MTRSTKYIVGCSLLAIGYSIPVAVMLA